MLTDADCSRSSGQANRKASLTSQEIFPGRLFRLCIAGRYGLRRQGRTLARVPPALLPEKPEIPQSFGSRWFVVSDDPDLPSLSKFDLLKFRKRFVQNLLRKQEEQERVLVEVPSRQIP